MRRPSDAALTLTALVTYLAAALILFALLGCTPGTTEPPEPPGRAAVLDSIVIHVEEAAP